jgi:hypothetical protein
MMGHGGHCNCCNCGHGHKDKEELTKEDLLEKKEWLKKKMDWVEEELKKLDK